MTSDNMAINSTNFNVDKNGNMSCSNATMNNASIIGGDIRMESSAGSNTITLINKNNQDNTLGISNSFMTIYGGADNEITINCDETGNTSIALVQGWNGYTSVTPFEVSSPTITQTSLESQKKNFEKYNNALDTLKGIDIYKYNLKSEEDDSKKHIGFVIGKDYEYSEEVTSKNNDGVDIYSFVSLCCKAIQEQQTQIEALQKEIQELKGGNK